MSTLGPITGKSYGITLGPIRPLRDVGSIRRGWIPKQYSSSTGKEERTMNAVGALIMFTPEFLGGAWLYYKHKNHHNTQHTVRLGNYQMSQMKDLFIRSSTDPDSGGSLADSVVVGRFWSRLPEGLENGLENERVWLRISSHLKEKERAWLQVACKQRSNRAVILWLTSPLSCILCIQGCCITATCDDPSTCMRQ